ncbi:molybdenum cofactor biosynthesis protein [candidate division TA06 bacterium DG_24]|uniref:Molybdopterin molybdenumtransferase n=1 Tax=candidate division TA06 bacterium DG_24 TaxID=1703770 RepID=A0A0S7WMW8_UNCT6|nr:MAG: molybdenum cofactor biosynthesis protein [candidate division TA06 bacterium DG_24]
MLPFWKVITREKAQGLYSELSPLETERLPIEDTLGRILAEDVHSGIDVPHFRRSNMDGYAVRAEDTYLATETSPIELKLTGVVEMGKEADVSVSPGSAVHIATGGMLPHGSDAVVMLEYTEQLDEDTIEIRRAAARGENVVSIGEDVKRGELLLGKGSRLRAQDIGALASIGVTKVLVYRRPRVAVLSTGDEIVPPDAEPRPGQVRGINLFVLSALTSEYGGIPIDFGLIRDDYETLRAKVAEALDTCDVVAISGGSSVGNRDITLSVIRSFEPEGVLAHGVAIRPGKPTILALINGKPVIGVPGHPVSATVVFDILVRPVIDRMMGCAEGAGERLTVRARLSRNVASPSGREDYLRVTLRREGDEWWADPVLGKSGAIRTLVKANGLVRIPLESEGLERGEWVEVRVF